jgi:hypothetical protein
MVFRDGVDPQTSGLHVDAQHLPDRCDQGLRGLDGEPTAAAILDGSILPSSVEPSARSAAREPGSTRLAMPEGKRIEELAGAANIASS